MKKLLFLTTLLALFGASLAGQETQTYPKIGLVAEGGISFGGDALATVIFTDGEDQDLNAGQGGYLAAGAALHFTENISLRGTLGFLYQTTAAENANIRLTRLPLNLVGFYEFSNGIRVGGGVGTHASIRLKGDGFLPDTEYTSNLGPRVELAYKWIGLSYTAMEYTSETDGVFSANAIGVSVSFVIPNRY